MTPTATTAITITIVSNSLLGCYELNSSSTDNNNNNNNLNINDQNFNVQSMGMANMGRKSSFHPVDFMRCSIGKFGVEAASSDMFESDVISNIIRCYQVILT